MGVDDGGTAHAVGEGGGTLVTGTGVEAGRAGVKGVGGFSVGPAVLDGAGVRAALAARGGRSGCRRIGGGWELIGCCVGLAWRQGLGRLEFGRRLR